MVNDKPFRKTDFSKKCVRRVDLHVLQNMSSGHCLLSAFRFLSYPWYPIKIIKVIIHKHKISKSKDKNMPWLGFEPSIANFRDRGLRSYLRASPTVTNSNDKRIQCAKSAKPFYLFTSMDNVQLSKHALTSLWTYLVRTVSTGEGKQMIPDQTALLGVVWSGIFCYHMLSCLRILLLHSKS